MGDHDAPPTPFVLRAKKAVVAACGAAAMLVSTGLLEEHQELWVNALLGLATAAGVYTARNETAA